ncbi:unnamed protein product, partial [Brassica oleracea var. botrytis]
LSFFTSPNDPDFSSATATPPPPTLTVPSGSAVGPGSSSFRLGLQFIQIDLPVSRPDPILISKVKLDVSLSWTIVGLS